MNVKEVSEEVSKWVLTVLVVGSIVFTAFAAYSASQSYRLQVLIEKKAVLVEELKSERSETEFLYYVCQDLKQELEDNSADYRLNCFDPLVGNKGATTQL